MPRKKPFRTEDFLARLPLFRELGEEELARIARSATTVDAPRGTALFRRGESCGGLHVVIHGQVQLALQSPRGDKKVIELVGPGQSFGDAMMFLDRPCLITAEALVDTKLLHVAKEAVIKQIERDPRFARRVIAGLSWRLHHLVSELEAITLHTGTERVIGYLLSQLPEEAGGAATVRLPAKKSVIASRLNVTHEHFSRILHELASAGLIEIGGREISIRDADRLRAFGAERHSG